MPFDHNIAISEIDDARREMVMVCDESVDRDYYDENSPIGDETFEDEDDYYSDYYSDDYFADDDYYFADGEE